jgi:hypothetical protein
MVWVVFDEPINPKRTGNAEYPNITNGQYGYQQSKADIDRKAQAKVTKGESSQHIDGSDGIGDEHRPPVKACFEDIVLLTDGTFWVHLKGLLECKSRVGEQVTLMTTRTLHLPDGIPLAFFSHGFSLFMIFIYPMPSLFL